jgi:hypothetical protein
MSVSTLPPLTREERVVEFLRANAEGNAFFTSVLSQFDRKGSLSEAQLASVERSINRPRPVREVQANPVTELGMYRKDGVVFRVKRSKQSGNLYAMRYNPLAPVKSERFVYERGGVFRLSADNRMTLAEAQKAGHEFGICCVCGAELSDPVSVERGIGPICVQRI